MSHLIAAPRISCYAYLPINKKLSPQYLYGYHLAIDAKQFLRSVSSFPAIYSGYAVDSELFTGVYSHHLQLYFTRANPHITDISGAYMLEHPGQEEMKEVTEAFSRWSLTDHQGGTYDFIQTSIRSR